MPDARLVEHIGDRHAQATDAGLVAAFSGLNRDPVNVRHGRSVRNDP